MGIDTQWHKDQIKKFSDVLPLYNVYAETMRSLFSKAIKIIAPEGIIQTRTKSLSSFAEKAIRKAYKYNDPVNQLTDLCGVRIIIESQEQVRSLSSFIKDNFDIDEKNSIDVSTRLKTSEFGYLSIHYIVTIKKSNIFDIEIPQEIKNLKAEIQVRTILQHMWASTCHDRIYKSSIKVPIFWQRESARLAAQIENADIAFERMASTLDSYIANYAIYLKKDELKAEINLLTAILANEPEKRNKPAITIKLFLFKTYCGKFSGTANALLFFSVLSTLPTLTQRFSLFRA